MVDSFAKTEREDNDSISAEGKSQSMIASLEKPIFETFSDDNLIKIGSGEDSM